MKVSLPASASGPSGVSHGHHQACEGGSNDPWGMKMQAGSACLHWALAGMHWPLLQKSPAGQDTAAQALGWVAGFDALQVPSAWQTPSAQSALVLHLPTPPTILLQSSNCASQASCSFLSTHAAASTQAANTVAFPDPIDTSQRLPARWGATFRKASGPVGGGRKSVLFSSTVMNACAVRS